MNGKGEGDDQIPKTWQSYMSTHTDAAIRTLHQASSSHLRRLQDVIPELRSHYSSYDHAFFNYLKDGLATGLQHPTTTAAFSFAALFLLFRGPRSFLLRHTVGRLQSEETRFVRAEKNVKMLKFSVDLMKKESRKLLERATLAEKEMTNGQTDLMNAGKRIQHLAKSVDHVEIQAADLVDLLREIPGREALQLRAEVASVASLLKQQRTGLQKRMFKLTEVGVPV